MEDGEGSVCGYKGSPTDRPLTKPESRMDSQTIGCTVRGNSWVGCDVTESCHLPFCCYINCQWRLGRSVQWDELLSTTHPASTLTAACKPLPSLPSFVSCNILCVMEVGAGVVPDSRPSGIREGAFVLKRPDVTNLLRPSHFAPPQVISPRMYTLYQACLQPSCHSASVDAHWTHTHTHSMSLHWSMPHVYLHVGYKKCSHAGTHYSLNKDDQTRWQARR